MDSCRVVGVAAFAAKIPAIPGDIKHRELFVFQFNYCYIGELIIRSKKRKIREATIDIQQLRYFVEVIEAGSLRKAADRLHIAQTAVGRQVKLLEDEFGKPLLERHPRGMSPTPAGQRLQLYATELLQSVEEIHHRMIGDQETVKGRAMLGVPTTLALILYGAMAERLVNEHPEIDLGVVQGNAYSIWAGLDANDINLAILVDPERKDNYSYETLLKEQMYFLSRADRTDVPQGPVNLAEIVQLPLIVYRRPTGPRNVFDRAMSRLNATPNIAYEVEYALVAKELISRGLAHGVLSQSDLITIKPDDTYNVVEIKNFTFNRTLVRPKKSPNQPVVDIVARIASEEFLKFHNQSPAANILHA